MIVSMEEKWLISGGSLATMPNMAVPKGLSRIKGSHRVLGMEPGSVMYKVSAPSTVLSLELCI